MGREKNPTDCLSLKVIKWTSGLAVAGILAYMPFGLYVAAQQGKINRELESQEHATRLLKEFDDNRNGVLDKVELLNYTRNFYTGRNPTKTKTQ